MYWAVGAIIAAGWIFGIFLYINEVRKSVTSENRRILNAYAKLWSLSQMRTAGSAELKVFYDEVVRKADFPMILTTVEGEPISWRNAGIPSTDTTLHSKLQLRGRALEMDGTNSPITVFIGETDRALGYIHFGESRFMSLLRFVPIVEFVFVALLLVLVYFSYSRLKYFEEQNIWLGMARETAHQLGTPISSLMGWLELLKEEIKSAVKAGAFVGASRKPPEIVSFMEEDVANLNRIVTRFGQVGSMPELEPTDLASFLGDHVDYLRKRLPRLLGQIYIIEQYEDVPKIMANPLLLSWAVENLIKNSMEAIPKTGGTIKVATRLDIERERVQIIVSDNGRGIQSRDTRKIFSPGFTSKKRGWGLGLSLTKRIVEQYHFGKLYLLESNPFDKTTFVMSFPMSSRPIKKIQKGE
jgi:signal transduction histidine kinase